MESDRGDGEEEARIEELIVLETERLALRRFRLEDAAFILELVNDPDWIRHIGDRHVRDLDAARAYIQKGALAMYERLGFGMYVVTPRVGGEAMGVCGIVRREGLDDVDLGFAFLPRYRGRGFAYESAAAVLEHGFRSLGLSRIVAIVSTPDDRSVALLTRLGFRFERMIRLPGDDEEIALYARGAERAPVGDSPAQSSRYVRS